MPKPIPQPAFRRARQWGRRPSAPRLASLALAWLFSALAISGCAVTPVHRETLRPEAHLDAIRAVIESGDWVLIRGVTRPGNVISTATNMPFTHGSVYDKETDEVIEADSAGVHLSSLAKYISEASRIWVLKPAWATDANRPLAVARARSFIGRPYDYWGLIGLGMPDSYYCSELAIEAWRPFMAKGGNPIPPVISPGRLHHWGRVVYDSMEIGLGVP